VQYQLSRIVAGPFLHTIWRPKVTGAEHVPASGGAILAGNHLSVVDSVFLPLMLDRPVTFSAKAEYFTASGPAARLWAAYLKATNQLQMDRDGPRAAQDTLEAALALLQAGNLFGIYPEGTRSPDGRLYRGRPGVGWLALKSARHQAGAAAGSRGAAAGADRGQDRRAVEVPRGGHRRAAGQGQAADRRAGDERDQGTVRPAVRAHVRLRPQSRTGSRGAPQTSLTPLASRAHAPSPARSRP
jgi:1-acyl-sn-glycerol-3-phosphate acyltransferase